MANLAIVAALEREVKPLTKRWRVADREHDGRRFRFFENDEAVLVCGGIGQAPARRASEAAIALYSPDVIYSVGYAGALETSGKVGDVLRPGCVINTSDGSRVQIAGGKGILVSSATVASIAQKAKLRELFAAQGVDMESAGVARAADARNVEFRVLKVISDEFDFELPASDEFVDSDGRFREARFGRFAAVRPWLWGAVMRLARNSRRATQVLCREIEFRILESQINDEN